MTTDHTPLKPDFFHILLALNDRELHGYAIIKAVDRATEGRIKLEPSPLYRRLRKLLDDGVIAESATRPPEEEDDDRRRYYRLTGEGRRILAAEAARLVALAEDGTVRRLAVEGSGG